MRTVNKSKPKEGGLGKILCEEVAGYIARGIEHNDAVDLFEGLLSQLSGQRKISKVTIVDQAIEYCHNHLGKLSDDELVVDFLQTYKTSMIARRRKGTKQQLSDASSGTLNLNTKLLNEIALIQNRARGKVYEQMGLVLVQYYLREIENYQGSINIAEDKVVFDCPNSKGKQSKRRFDLFLLDFQIGVEIKSGRVTYRGSIRDQIYKDHFLMKKGDVQDVWWFLFYGASKRVISELNKRNIAYIDFGFNDFEEISSNNDPFNSSIGC
jgi:hypothetical protein